jgi:phosphoribosyl-AMP cyclohydrolase
MSDKNAQSNNWLDQVTWNEQGLVAVIAQEFDTGDVLMMAWMNRESLQLTLEKGEAVYWSRSRKKIWHKGEESGHVQAVKSSHLDSDGDTILIKVDKKYRIACHTGDHSFFFLDLEKTPNGPVWKK